ncbi:hypothetical protein [Bacillus proteolyticus]|uniref:hypothetical protein n=1 Tax=Bacillus proteolyticus TaxID=2026192 RepID=UPI0030F49769
MAKIPTPPAPRIRTRSPAFMFPLSLEQLELWLLHKAMLQLLLETFEMALTRACLRL